MSTSALAQSASPYIRLHKDNPVAWRLWSEDVLAEAEKTGKPILLSLGYTGCHWCHVMNRDGFSDAATAAQINENFIPVLVDREERPDIDQIYQAAARFLGYDGGWPLNIFLNAKGAPYFVTGYLPKEERLGQPSLGKVLTDVAALYQDKPEQVAATAATVLQQLENYYNRSMRASPESILLDVAALRIGQRYDIFMGGVTGNNKFAQVPQLDVLWRAFLRGGAPQYLQLVTTTLDNVVMGGLYDHVGGGFFRYTSDESWLVPHFEKTLYDNAQIISFLTGIWQFNRNDLVRQRVAETVDWLLREMKLGDGFAAGLDSNSEGEEGKYYLWSEAEIDAALVGTFSARFKQVYGVTRDGSLMGKNVLRRAGHPQAPVSAADEQLLARQRALVLAARDKRVHPMRDDKLVTDWNGMVIAALALAGAVFERGDWIAAAIAAYDEVKAKSGEGATLHHVWAEGQRGDQGFADDYAQMAHAAVQLWEVTGDKRFVDDARAWVGTLNTRYWNEQLGGYCFTANDVPPLVVRTRGFVDQPTPSANASMVTVLVRLATITGEIEFGARAHALLAAFTDEIGRNPLPCAEFLNGLEYFASNVQVVVIGPRGHMRTQEFVRTVWGKALPYRLLVQVESSDELVEGHPAHGKPLQNGQPTVYLVQGNQCSPPVTSAVTLSQALTLPKQAQQRAAQ